MIYLYFLERRVVQNVMYAPGQVGDFDPTDQAETDALIAAGSARAATVGERDDFLASQAEAEAAAENNNTFPLPSGGDTGQALVKASDVDFDVEWGAAAGGSGGGFTSIFTPENVQQPHNTTSLQEDATLRFPVLNGKSYTFRLKVFGFTWPDPSFIFAITAPHVNNGNLFETRVTGEHLVGADLHTFSRNPNPETEIVTTNFSKIVIDVQGSLDCNADGEFIYKWAAKNAFDDANLQYGGSYIEYKEIGS